MTVEETAAGIISKVGLWWPLAEEDQLRQAAAAYEKVAHAILSAAGTGTAGASIVTGGGNKGAAIDAFGRHWAQFDGGSPGGLPATAKAAASVAAALQTFAHKVEVAKRKIINLAIEIAATIAVGVAMAWFSFGTSAGAALLRTAMLVARGFTIAIGLSGAASTIVATALVGGVFGAVEGFLGSIVAQIGKTVLSDGDGINFGETMSWTLWGGAGGFVFAGAGSGLRSGFRALRHGDGAVAGKLKNAAKGFADDMGAPPRPVGLADEPTPFPRADFDGNPAFRSTQADREAYRQGQHLADWQDPESWWQHATNMTDQRALAQNPALRDIPIEDLVAVHEYGAADSWHMNSALRNGDPELMAKWAGPIRNATSGLNQLPPYEGVVRRRITALRPGHLDEIVGHYNVGEIIEEPAFVSASIDKMPKGGEVEFIIQSRTGRSIEGISMSGGESEVLFAPGSQFRVLDKKLEGNIWRIYLDDVTGSFGP